MQRSRGKARSSPGGITPCSSTHSPRSPKSSSSLTTSDMLKSAPDAGCSECINTEQGMSKPPRARIQPGSVLRPEFLRQDSHFRLRRHLEGFSLPSWSAKTVPQRVGKILPDPSVECHDSRQRYRGNLDEGSDVDFAVGRLD